MTAVIVKMSEWIERKVLSRGRVPLMDTHQPSVPGEDLTARLTRIKESLSKIDALMKELKGDSR
jgi:hypothetical protein